MAELVAGRGSAALHCRNDSIASVLAGVRADQATSPEQETQHGLDAVSHATEPIHARKQLAAP